MWTDFRLALRSLRSTPGFTTIALVVLALGIGATTAIFSVVDAIVLRGLPFDAAHRLVAVDEANPTAKGLPGGYVAAPNFYDWRARQTLFEDLAAYQGKAGFTLRDSGEPEDLRTQMTSASLFGLLRANPQIGRLFTSAEEVAGRDRVALISDGLWRRRFNADPNVIGKTLRFEAGLWEVIGVMPEGFTFPVGPLRATDLWVPFVPTKDEFPRGDGSSRNYNAQVIGRLKDGVTIDQARAQMEQITGVMKAEHPKWFSDRWVAVVPLQDFVVGKSRAWMLLLLGSVAFVLLIACVNVANLLLARASARVRDVSVRAALGATRWQLARAFLAESLVLSVIGTTLGVVLALWGVEILKAALPTSLPRLAQVGLDLRVLAAAAGAAIVTGLAFGVMPAWQFSRPRLADALREGGRSGHAGLARGRGRSALLVAEVALATVLLIGAALFITSFARLVRVDIGLDTGRLLTVGVYPRIDFQSPKIDDDMARAGVIIGDVFERVRSVPGVEVAAFTSGNLPLSTGWSRSRLRVPGRAESDTDERPDVKSISPDYFRALQVPILAGRAFSDADTSASGSLVIVNDEVVKQYFGGRDPIGTEVEVNGKRTVVGVVRTVRIGGPEAPMRPEVFLPFNPKRAFGVNFIVRTARDPASIAPDVRAAIRAAAPGLVIPEPQTMDAMYDRLILQRKFNMIVLALFGGLAIVIAAAGIYGVMAYVVEQRASEIGVRMALGARPGQMLNMILTRATLVMGIGLTIGLVTGLALARLVGTFLFRVEARDPVVYAGAAATLMLAGLIAAFVPARRASKVDPITVLNR